MRKPPFLVAGDTISLVAPSFGAASEPYITRTVASIARLQKEGFRIEVGPNVYRADGIASSASPEERAKEIMDAFASDASLILSVGGGELMCDILPLLDFDAIRRMPPKWFMGFSDNANLTFTLATLADTMAIYGPCAGQFFRKEFRYSENDAMAMLRGETHFEGYPKYSITKTNPLHPLWTYRMTQPKIITPMNYDSPFHGLLLGGCLDIMLMLCGTRFDRVKEFNAAHKEGVIWFLEACDLSPLSIRRGLFQLLEAGWFDNAVGFLIGRPYCKDAEIFGVDKFNAVTDILSKLNKPILMDVDLGHISPSLPMLTGAEATVRLKEGNIIIDYED